VGNPGISLTVCCGGAAPRQLQNRPGVELEADHPTADRALLWRGKPSSAFWPLTAQGHRIDRDAMVSGLHIIARSNFGGRVGADSKRKWAGGADPRPEGLAAGE
jgi:gamma-glutamyltranspeptidase